MIILLHHFPFPHHSLKSPHISLPALFQINWHFSHLLLACAYILWTYIYIFLNTNSSCCTVLIVCFQDWQFCYPKVINWCAILWKGHFLQCSIYLTYLKFSVYSWGLIVFSHPLCQHLLFVSLFNSCWSSHSYETLCW